MEHIFRDLPRGIAGSTNYRPQGLMIGVGEMPVGQPVQVDQATIDKIRALPPDQQQIVMFRILALNGQTFN
jgi:hypothetical protein